MPQFHRTAQHEFYAFFVCCKLRTHSGNLKVENRMIITKKMRFVVIVLLAVTMCCCRQDRSNGGIIDSSSSVESLEDSLIQVQEAGTITNSNKPSVSIYVENSGSMYGYVKGYTDFIDVVNKLVYDDDFVKESVNRKFYFINGDGQKPNKTFSDGQAFLGSMNEKGMKSGNYLTSDLNGMLKSLLAGANGDTVTILISDGIYDIGCDNLTKLKSKGQATKSTFIEMLKKNESIQTMVIKMVSSFDGKYCYATNSSSRYIHNQPRPYYIWIFGKGELLKKYFSDEKISKWPGYKNHARFQTIQKSFVISGEGRKGEFRNHGKNVLSKCKTHHNVFAFSIIVDYETLPYSDDYLSDTNNYSCDNNFDITSITKANDISTVSAGVCHYKRPFIITVQTNRKPLGSVNIKLNNNIPAWIMATNADDEKNIDSEHTFGFATLMDGVVNAYSAMSATCPASFSVIFNK